MRITFCIVILSWFCVDVFFYFGWLIIYSWFRPVRVDRFRVCFVLWWCRTVRIGFVAFGILFVLALRDFDGGDVAMSRGKRWFCNCFFVRRVHCFFLYCVFMLCVSYVVWCRCALGRLGLAGSMCVFVLWWRWAVRIGFVAFGFCSCWPCGILMATMSWCRGKRWICVDVCIGIIDLCVVFVSWCRVDVSVLLWFCVQDLCWCVSLVLWCKCVHSFYINNRQSILMCRGVDVDIYLMWRAVSMCCLLLWCCDIGVFVAFCVVNVGPVVWCFFYQMSGRGLCLRLTDEVSFLVLFIFVSRLVMFCGG